MSSYIYKISVPFKNDSTIEASVTGVEARSCLAADTSLGWTSHISAPLAAGVVIFSGVTLGDTYAIQLRYVSNNGFAGPWSDEILHTVVGNIQPPANVSSVIRVIPEGGVLRITWLNNPEIDVAGYEVREVEAAPDDPGALFTGSSNTCLVLPGPANVAKTWYIKAYRDPKIYSLLATSVNFTVVPPLAPTNITAKYSSNITAVFKWEAALPGTFAIRNYKLSLTGVGFTTVTVTRDTTDWEIPVSWKSAVTLTIIPVDIAGYEYVGQSNTVVLPMSIPTKPASPTVTTSGTDLILEWPDNVAADGQLPSVTYKLVDANTGEVVWESPK